MPQYANAETFWSDCCHTPRVLGLRHDPAYRARIAPNELKIDCQWERLVLEPRLESSANKRYIVLLRGIVRIPSHMAYNRCHPGRRQNHRLIQSASA
jgi:hypothetical protein